jgi:hypothetical protein
MRCSLREHSGGCGRGSLDAVPLPAITEQRRVSGRSSNGNPDQPIRSSLILNPEFLSAEVLEETWRTLVQAAERGLGGLLVIAFR